ncbi:MAG: hemolysin family protein [Hydrococcus sp. Prado102]|nr:hemolysin family protein [Hydrococcus sp. Prado102]
MTELILAVLMVISGSALCSGVEAAVLSVPILKVRQLAQSNRRSAVTLLSIREKINRPIGTLVIVNNIFNIVGSIVVAQIAENTLGDRFLGIVSGILTFLIIIFGEIIPKTIGERNAIKIALLASVPLTFLTVVFIPLVWIVEKAIAPFTKGAKQPITNEAEIQLMATLGHQEGAIEDDELEMLLRVFRLNDAIARDLMTPRTALTYLSGNQSLEEAKQQIIDSQHTRIIIAGDSIDEAIGVALKAELLAALVEGKGDRIIAAFAREVRFVPETVQADILLKTFQASREHLAVVVDEYGLTVGVITLEDVLEVLTGEIVDETDRNIDLQEVARRRLKRLTE